MIPGEFALIDQPELALKAPFAGVVKSIAIKVGDSVSQGTLIAELEVVGRFWLLSMLQATKKRKGISKAENFKNFIRNILSISGVGGRGKRFEMNSIRIESIDQLISLIFRIAKSDDIVG